MSVGFSVLAANISWVFGASGIYHAHAPRANAVLPVLVGNLRTLLIPEEAAYVPTAQRQEQFEYKVNKNPAEVIKSPESVPGSSWVDIW